MRWISTKCRQHVFEDFMRKQTVSCRLPTAVAIAITIVIENQRKLFAQLRDKVILRSDLSHVSISISISSFATRSENKSTPPSTSHAPANMRMNMNRFDSFEPKRFYFHNSYRSHRREIYAWLRRGWWQEARDIKIKCSKIEMMFNFNWVRQEANWSRE